MVAEPTSTYNITASASPNGTVNSGGILTFAHGANQTYYFYPNAGYQVADVLVDGTSVGAVTSYTFNNIQASHTIGVSFAANASASISASIDTINNNGTISPVPGTFNLLAGQSQTFTFTPNANYRVNVVVDGVSQGNITSYTFNNIKAGNHIIVASFIPDTFNVTATVNSAGGYITSGTTTITSSSIFTLSRGSSLGFTITPDTGYDISNVFVNGASIGAVGSYSFSSLQANQALSVNFTKKTYTVTASVGANGSANSNGALTFTYGANQTYYFYPNAGYHVADVLIDGGSVGAVTSYTFTNIQAGHTVSVSFDANASAPITASIDTVNNFGTMNPPAGTISMLAGQSQTFTFTPSSSLYRANVVVDGVSQENIPSYTFNNIKAGNHTIVASFVLDGFNVNASVYYKGGGSILCDGTSTITSASSANINVARAGGLNCGFTPDTGYKVSNVIVNGASKGTPANYQFTNIQANQTLSVIFAKQTFTINASAGAYGSMNSSGTFTYSYGANQTYYFYPIKGYHVADVLVDGGSVGAVTSYTFSNIQASHIISVAFAPVP